MAQTSFSSDDPVVIDDRPIAVRRKRRCNSALVDPLHEPKIEPLRESDTSLPEATRTPSKPKKKARFSDPGPDVSTPASSSMASTGLTPALSRTSFAPFGVVQTPRLLARPSRPSQRLSLPDLRATIRIPSPRTPLSPGPLSGEIQFAPLRTLIDDRMRRRLKRSHLSEEFNDIAAEKKSIKHYKLELEDLKTELALARKQQMHGEANGESSASRGLSRVQELERELTQLKEEKQDQLDPVDPSVPVERNDDPLTLNSITFTDDTIDQIIEEYVESDGGLRERTLIPEPPAYSDASTQDTSPYPKQAETLRSARLSLEYLFPGEVALGLVPDDPKPLFDAMLERLQALQTRALIAEDSLSTTQIQESNLRTQFNSVLEQLDRARKYAEKVGTKNVTEKARADAAESKVGSLETSVQNATDNVRDLKSSADEKSHSIHRLHGALESYRIEVGKLELLITRIESEHKTAIANVRSEMDEAVADLECHVAAETIGRRAAESELEESKEKIKELTTRERELKEAVNEKQQILRDVEKAFVQDRTAREREVGTLSVQISQLSSDLNESSIQREQAERACDRLKQQLEEEQEASRRALAASAEETKRCSSGVAGIQAAYESDSKKRGAHVLEHQGLLTPTTGCRFRDADEIEGIEGFVEVHRGKNGKHGKGRKRPDSGVVILEEDADEDMVMNDY